MVLSIDNSPGYIRDLSGEFLLWGFALDKVSNFIWEETLRKMFFLNIWNFSKVWPKENFWSHTYIYACYITIIIFVIILSSLSNMRSFSRFGLVYLCIRPIIDLK